MTDKILELTEKIYNEGIVKANKDADQIIANAKNEAGEIIKKANQQKSEIVDQAKKQAEELKNITDSELQIAARQFISNVKQQLTNLIVTAQVIPPVNKAFSDSEFIKDIILTIIQKWNLQKPDDLSLTLLLPGNKENEFSDFLEKRALDILNTGIELQFDPKIKSGFKIGPKDGSYIVSFSEKDFENYFKKYVKEKTKKLLFNP